MSEAAGQVFKKGKGRGAEIIGPNMPETTHLVARFSTQNLGKGLSGQGRSDGSFL